MNCRECQVWLQASLDDRRLMPTPEVRGHVRECEACRRDVAAARVMLGGLTRSFSPNALMTASIASAVQTDRQNRRRRSVYRLYATASLAACLLLIFGIAWLVPVLKTTPQVAKIEPPKTADQTPDLALTQSATDAQKAVASLTRSVAEKTKSRINVFIPETPSIDVSLPPLPEFDEPFDPAAQSLKQAGLTVAHSFEPVAQTAVRAFDFFAREMPVFDFSKN